MKIYFLDGVKVTSDRFLNACLTTPKTYCGVTQSPVGSDNPKEQTLGAANPEKNRWHSHVHMQAGER